MNRRIKGAIQNDSVFMKSDNKFMQDNDSVVKEAEPTQASKNLKDYDCWDEDLKPEEWLEKYQGTPPPHGKSPIYIKG